MQKPKRENLKSVLALSIKPPAYELDKTGGEDHTYKCVYVTNQGKQITHKCNHAVWKRCEGRNVQGRARDGLADKLNCQFLIWIDPNKNEHASTEAQKGLVVDIDVLPENYYQRRQVMPSDVADRETIDIKVGPSGYIEILALPPGVTRQMVERMIRELNKLDTLVPGQLIQGGYEVETVAGSTVSLLPPVKVAA